MDTLGKRLKFYLEKVNVSAGQFSEKTGIPEPSVYRAFKSNGLNSTTLAHIIENYPELNITWLITGNGNYRNEDSYCSTAEEEREPYLTKNDAELKTKVRSILTNDVVLDVLVEILKRYEK